MVLFSLVKAKISDNYEKNINKTVDYYANNIVLQNNQLIVENDSIEKPRMIQNAYVEITDLSGNPAYKSENLKDRRLSGSVKKLSARINITEIDNVTIAFIRKPIILNNKTEGYILTGVDIDETQKIAHTLGHIIFLLYPLILIILFFIARIVAKNSIKPIHNIILTANTISRENLSTRIPLPSNKDELYELSLTINNLLDRIENAFEREKSFTSYASHEFRTPLAVLKGTMEVLIRKPRTEEEYKEKISFCINEIDRLNILVEELLLLTRYENQRRSLNCRDVLFEDTLSGCLGMFSNEINEKGISIKPMFHSGNMIIKTDEYLLSTILNNLLSNAIKYSYERSTVEIQTYENEKSFVCEIRNRGMGIPDSELHNVFDKFYRSRSADISDTKGFGLGLSIVKHFAEMLNIGITIENKENNTIQSKLVIPMM